MAAFYETFATPGARTGECAPAVCPECGVTQLTPGETSTHADSGTRIAAALCGILIGSLVTLWLGEAALDLAHRMLDRLSGRRERVNFELHPVWQYDLGKVSLKPGS